MRIVQWCRMASVAALIVGTAPAMAQTCVGFTDVPAADAFCPNIEWMKNRGITTGCTSATVYCPGGNVTRSAMSAFMNRLGNALTPEDVPAVAFTSTGRLALNTPPIVCQTSDYGVTGYPRRAQFNSKVNVYNPSTDVELKIDVMYSAAAGAPGTWVSIAGSQVYQTLRAGGAVIDDVTMYPIGFWDLAVGSSYRFGIRIARQSGSGDPEVYCENRVSITNRNSATPPRDEIERTGRAAQFPPQ